MCVCTDEVPVQNSISHGHYRERDYPSVFVSPVSYTFRFFYGPSKRDVNGVAHRYHYTLFDVPFIYIGGRKKVSAQYTIWIYRKTRFIERRPRFMIFILDRYTMANAPPRGESWKMMVIVTGRNTITRCQIGAYPKHERGHVPLKYFSL